MMEYEYSFKVKSLKPYIEYCIKNGYELKSDVKQMGRVLKADNNTTARIKVDLPKKGTPKKVLDFKDADDSKALIKERRETLPLVFEDDEAVESILEFLGYTKKDGSYIRRRRVFVKGNVIFEMDYYIKSRNKVMAIEGVKEDVDRVYEEIKDIELKTEN